MAACLKCPLVSAAGRLNIPAAVLTAHPALEFLCTEHFKEFEILRTAKATREARESKRIWCSCGREKYLDRPGPCSACSLGQGPPAPAEKGWSPSAVHGAAAPVHARLSCYGLAGRCPNPGELYPGGPYCSEHHPVREDWMNRGR